MFASKICISLIMISLATPEQRVPFFLERARHCTGDDCTPSDRRAHAPLNESVEPCANFYEFACGTWIAKTAKPRSEPVWSPWTAASHEIARRLLDVLTAESEDVALSKAQLFHDSCLSAPAFETKYLRHLKVLVNELHGWPAATVKWTVGGYDWLEEIMRVTRLLGISPVLKVHVDIDYKNTTRYVLYIEPGTLIFPYHMLVSPLKYPVEMAAYEKWIYGTVKHMYNKSGFDVKRSVKEIVNFEVQLAKLRKKPRNERLTVRKLSKKIPVDWTKVLNILFDGTAAKISDNDTVIIKNYPYLKNLFGLVGNVDRAVANYIIWSVVKDLSRETTRYMRNLSFLVDRAVLGVQSDLTRQIECIAQTGNHFGHAMVSKYVELHLGPGAISRVEQMVDSIAAEFVATIEASEWLSQEAKSLSAEKAKGIRSFVGFPQWASDSVSVRSRYEGLNVTGNHFLNVLRAKNFKMETQLAKLRRKVSEVEWPSTVFDVNAYYSILQNSIFIPLGLLLPPFFDIERPPVMNYGALGTLIGHELSHSLDALGRQADKNGIITKWWPLKDVNLYQNRAKCFEERYDDFGGALTVGEDIADSVGVDVSLGAYRKSDEARLSGAVKGLEAFKEDQLFFVSFAQMWCEISDGADIFEDGDHAPVRDRVNGTVGSSGAFASAFNCTAGTGACRLCESFHDDTYGLIETGSDAVFALGIAARIAGLEHRSVDEQSEVMSIKIT